jgi:hypothetical protein
LIVGIVRNGWWKMASVICKLWSGLGLCMQIFSLWEHWQYIWLRVVVIIWHLVVAEDTAARWECVCAAAQHCWIRQNCICHCCHFKPLATWGALFSSFVHELRSVLICGNFLHTQSALINTCWMLHIRFERIVFFFPHQKMLKSLCILMIG